MLGHGARCMCVGVVDTGTWGGVVDETWGAVVVMYAGVVDMYVPHRGCR